jgi:hypothetical protein
MVTMTESGARFTDTITDDVPLFDTEVDPFIPDPFDPEAEEWAAANLAAAIPVTDDAPVNWQNVYRYQDAARYRIYRSNGRLNVGSMTLVSVGPDASAVCRYCGKRVTMAQCVARTMGDNDAAEELFTALVFAHGYSEQSRFLARDGKIGGAYAIDTKAIWDNYLP